MTDVRRIDGYRAEEAGVTLDDLAREGAWRMIAAALEAEVDDYVTGLVDEIDAADLRRRPPLGAPTATTRSTRARCRPGLTPSTAGRRPGRWEDAAMIG